MNQTSANRDHMPKHGIFAVVWGGASICLAFLFALAGCDQSSDYQIPSPLPIEVVGNDYYWFVRYPGADGKLHTADDVHDTTNLHLPVATETHIQITSRDYLYTFGLPDLELNQVAVPDLMFGLKFSMDRVGTYQLEGDQLCGFSHESLMGRVFVQSRDEFTAWLRTQQFVPEPRLHERGI